jgi:hypothetical protein
MAEPETSAVTQPELSREELLRQWLGLSRPDPTYYTLLGVPELESDAEAIHHAGRHIKRKLRAYQIGTYRKQALDLLTEVGQAVAVLTNDEKKRAYDRELLARWKLMIPETYRLYCEGTPRDPPVLEAWLGTCAARGLPVTRLLGPILRRVQRGLGEWPPHGAHSLGLPINLWLYRDVVILGQCVAQGALEQRAEAVKKIQKQLGVTEGLARLVAEEVVRSQHLFGRRRLVVVARRDPVGLLVRLGQRIRRCGGHIGRQAKVVVAVGALLGVSRPDMTEALQQLARAHDKSAERRTAAASGEPRPKDQGARYRLADLLADRPLGLTVALAALVGLAVLVAVFLIASGLSSGDQPQTMPVGGSAAPEPPAGPPHSPASVGPDISELEMLRPFNKKYPVTVPKPKERPPVVEPEPAPAEETGSEKPATKFFDVPATKTKTPPKKK